MAASSCPVNHHLVQSAMVGDCHYYLKGVGIIDILLEHLHGGFLCELYGDVRVRVWLELSGFFFFHFRERRELWEILDPEDPMGCLWVPIMWSPPSACSCDLPLTWLTLPYGHTNLILGAKAIQWAVTNTGTSVLQIGYPQSQMVPDIETHPSMSYDWRSETRG